MRFFRSLRVRNSTSAAWRHKNSRVHELTEDSTYTGDIWLVPCKIN